MMKLKITNSNNFGSDLFTFDGGVAKKWSDEIYGSWYKCTNSFKLMRIVVVGKIC